MGIDTSCDGGGYCDNHQVVRSAGRQCSYISRILHSLFSDFYSISIGEDINV